jgi:hypothetical protein
MTSFQCSEITEPTGSIQFIGALLIRTSLVVGLCDKDYNQNDLHKKPKMSGSRD